MSAVDALGASDVAAPAAARGWLQRLRWLGFASLAALVLLSMLSLEPKRRGDGNSYFLVLESLSRHASTELQLDDIRAFYDGRLNGFGEAFPPRMGYYEGRDGQWYSGHFWAYAATSVPAKWTLEALGGDARKAFQLTNALLFCALLAGILFASKLAEVEKWTLVALCVASPVMWYLHWTHPEVFIFCFALAALLAMQREMYPVAVAAAAIGSLQNQTLGLFAIYLGLCGLFERGDDGAPRGLQPKRVALLLLAGTPVLWPPLYNYAHFGTFSILTNWLSSDGMLGRMVDIFFDLNLGLLPYVPVTLILYLGLLAHQVFVQRRLTRDGQLFLVVLGMMCVACMQSNWNNDASGPNRYAIWMVLPFALYSLATHARSLLASPVLRGVAAGGLLLQLAIVAWLGPFDSKLSYVEHSPAARFVLERAPSLYAPAHEIFCERVSHSEAPCDGLAIYATTRCHKALVGCDRLPELAARCGGVPEPAKQRCSGASEAGLFYVDY